MTPTEQRNHIADGDYVWCDGCDGNDRNCGLCGGEGIVFDPDAAMLAVTQAEQRRAA